MTTIDFSNFQRFVPPAAPTALFSARQAAVSIAMAMSAAFGELACLDTDELSRLDSDMQGVVVDMFMRPSS